MKHYTGHYTLIALSLLLLSGCGIPDYPYVYPPDRLADLSIGFTHNSDNDPNVFEGYEIYYRIYQNPKEDTAIESEMDGYFNSTSSFQNISTEDYLGEVWYRRLVITDTDGTPLLSIPHVAISLANRDREFEVELTYTSSDGYIEIYFGSDLKLRGYRDNTADDGSNLFALLSYDVDDTDIAQSIDPSEALDIAFFAVPYGSDPVNPTPIYANGRSEDMLYIGKLRIP